MSRIINLLICLTLSLWVAGCKPAETDPNTTEKEQPAVKTANEKPEFELTRNTNGEAVLTLSPEVQTRIGLVVAPVTAAEHAPELKAYGQVIDPAPLIGAQGEMAAAEASIASLKTLAERARALFEQGETVSRKTMEGAQADLRVAQIKAQAARRQFENEWGETIGKLDDVALQKLVEQLASRQVVMARADLSPGDRIAGLPLGARMSTLGEERWKPAEVVGPVARTDPKTQGQGFLLRAEGPDSVLRPGAAITALFKLPGDPVKGVAIGESAILRVNGKTWVEVAGPENQFTRREVVLSVPLDRGWLATKGVAPGEKIVVEGAQTLLSEEQKSQTKED